MDAHGTCASTSPLRGEVAATRRVGVTHRERHGLLYMPQVTPPRSFAPTLPLEGRVDTHGTCSFTSPLRGEVAATRRVGVIRRERHCPMYTPQVTPPRHCVPTLPLEGRVDGHATCCSKTG